MGQDGTKMSQERPKMSQERPQDPLRNLQKSIKTISFSMFFSVFRKFSVFSSKTRQERAKMNLLVTSWCCLFVCSLFSWWKVSVTRCLEGVVHLHGAKHASPCRPCLHGGTCFPACKIDGNCTKNRCLDSVLGAQKDDQKVR